MADDKIKKLVRRLNSLQGPALLAELEALTDEELAAVIDAQDTADHVRKAAEEIKRRRDKRDDNDDGGGDQPPPPAGPKRKLR